MSSARTIPGSYWDYDNCRWQAYTRADSTAAAPVVSRIEPPEAPITETPEPAAAQIHSG